MEEILEGAWLSEDRPDRHEGTWSDLDALVSELGQTYPLMAYSAEVEEAEEQINEQILAGLVHI